MWSNINKTSEFLQLKISQYYWLMPIAFLFISIFLLRSKVQYVYLAAGLLIGLTVMAHRLNNTKPDISLARWLAALAAIGLSAAVILSIEKVELLSQPNHISSCSLSPIVACSPVIESPQASIFGFSNSFIGIFGFTAVLVAAMTLAAGANKLARLWWRTLLGGVSFGAVFCVWLFYQGVFEIGKLCLYCTLVWLVTFAMLWLLTDYCVKNNHVTFGKKLNKLLGFKYELITTTYLIILVLIFYRWPDYWLSLV